MHRPMRRTLPLVLADPNVDAVIALFVPPVVEDPRAVVAVLEQIARGIAETAAAGRDERRRVRQWRLRVPGVRCPRTRARCSTARTGCGGPPATTPEFDIDSTRAADHRRSSAATSWLDAEAAHALLERYGIPLVAERHAATPEDAAVGCDRARSSCGRQDRRLPARTRPRAAGWRSTFVPPTMFSAPPRGWTGP